ncbi:putative baseplate assembly protein [Actinomadura kijaniata]|uniref:Baseplate protein J-like domain-containing protein n=1 Tax=Actinomadura namibiensis TaxID=182080 RepID=A0A7W3LYA8_ACTNM|nr:putative baseplate assembly protein [Actinomadura namibiensis]MBA8956585.1 hypothetical protein [Actinomadura namibiensis]
MSTDGFADVAFDREARVALARGSVHNGIDFVEVLANREGEPGFVADAARHRILLVYLLHGPVPDELDHRRVAVAGGVRPDPRVNPVRVLWAYPVTRLAGADPLAGVAEADRMLAVAAAGEHADRILAVRTTTSGDWSTYVLRLLGPGGAGVPAGFDAPLAEAPFTFTVDCQSDLDCRQEAAAADPETAVPAGDYLARDYEALRVRLLDRLSTLLPGWSDSNPADLGVMLAELFAHVGDRLAYWQDAVAVEAYLSTARRRTSVRRHARLLDYQLHEGCAARTFLAFTTEGDTDLPAGTAVADQVSGPGTIFADVEDALARGATVFETCHAATLTRGRNRMALHSWGDTSSRLDAGARSAYVDAGPTGAAVQLHEGDVLILAELGPDGEVAGGDPQRRYVMRLDRPPVAHTDPLAAPGRTLLHLHWHADDALRGPLTVSRPRPDGRADVAAVALANVVAADHGGTVTGLALDPSRVPRNGAYRPRLRRTGLAWAQRYAPSATDSAAAMLRPDPHRAESQITLHDGRHEWQARPDLLTSRRIDRHVTVEVEADGSVRLRFGDGEFGRRPGAGARPVARCRIGGGAEGNVAADQLSVLVPAAGRQVPDGVAVTNPLGAMGGRAPQSHEQARRLAPFAFHDSLRAVTPSDYSAVAMRHPAVQRAVARRRWTGSWYTVEVTIDPIGGQGLDPAVTAQVARVLNTQRLAGVDVEFAPPVYVPLEIVLTACVRSGHPRAEVAKRLGQVLGTGLLPDGRRGLFHPDNLTFGQPVYLSDLVAAVMAVPGVISVDVDDAPPSPNSFRRRDRPPGGDVAAGRIDLGPREVARADNDPSNPEHGRVEILLRGGEA